MSRGDVFRRWEQEQTVVVKTRLHRVYDADIIEALSRCEANGEQKATTMKRWARIGIEADKNNPN